MQYELTLVPEIWKAKRGLSIEPKSDPIQYRAVRMSEGTRGFHKAAEVCHQDVKEVAQGLEDLVLGPRKG